MNIIINFQQDNIIYAIIEVPQWDHQVEKQLLNDCICENQDKVKLPHPRRASMCSYEK